MKKFLCVALFGVLSCLGAVTVDPANAVIVVDKKADGTVKFAGVELQRHLQMITGTKIPVVNEAPKGKYSFLMGTPAGVSCSVMRMERLRPPSRAI